MTSNAISIHAVSFPSSMVPIAGAKLPIILLLSMKKIKYYQPFLIFHHPWEGFHIIEGCQGCSKATKKDAKKHNEVILGEKSKKKTVIEQKTHFSSTFHVFSIPLHPYCKIGVDCRYCESWK